MTASIVRPFRSANVDLTLLRGPLRNVNRDIFQMDILRSYRRECVRIWPGHAKNRLEVIDVEPGLRQLVLLVQEPVRTFTEKVDKARMPNGRVLPHTLRPGERVTVSTDTHWVVERRTDDSLRRYLCGMDETHLFVAQFRDGVTVREAHASLRPEEVEGAERRAPGETVRQGEWFFIPLETGERETLEASLRRSMREIRRNAPVGPGGKPHVADQVLIREDRSRWIRRRSGWVLGRVRVYARGAVRHPDHATLHLDSWRRVVRNAEIRPDHVGDDGILWVD